MRIHTQDLGHSSSKTTTFKGFAETMLAVRRLTAATFLQTSRNLNVTPSGLDGFGYDTTASLSVLPSEERKWSNYQNVGLVCVLCVCVCVCVCVVCVCVCVIWRYVLECVSSVIWTYVIHTHMYTYICVCIHVRIHACMLTHISYMVCIHIGTLTYIYAYMYAYLCVYIHVCKH